MGYLVLSRHVDQSINIKIPVGYKGLTEDVNIDILVVDILSGNKVKLGFKAATKIEIYRNEILEAREIDKIAAKKEADSIAFIPLKGVKHGINT